MEEVDPELMAFFRPLVDELTRAIRRDAYNRDIERICKLATANQKLIFLFTTVFQPQHWSSYRRILGIRSENTLDESLEALREGGFIAKDANHFWWISRNEKGRQLI